MQPTKDGGEPSVPDGDDRKALREAIMHHSEDNSA